MSWGVEVKSSLSSFTLDSGLQISNFRGSRTGTLSRNSGGGGNHSITFNTPSDWDKSIGFFRVVLTRYAIDESAFLAASFNGDKTQITLTMYLVERGSVDIRVDFYDSNHNTSGYGATIFNAQGKACVSATSSLAVITEKNTIYPDSSWSNYSYNRLYEYRFFYNNHYSRFFKVLNGHFNAMVSGRLSDYQSNMIRLISSQSSIEVATIDNNKSLSAMDYGFNIFNPAGDVIFNPDADLFNSNYAMAYPGFSVNNTNKSGSYAWVSFFPSLRSVDRQNNVFIRGLIRNANGNFTYDDQFISVLPDWGFARSSLVNPYFTAVN